MITPPFEYEVPTTIPEAIGLLDKHEDAKILAGGQSLLPMMKFRLASPGLLIDINRIIGLDYVREEGGFLKIGALTREAELDRSELVHRRYPLLADTCRLIADPTVRNLATIGGNLSHADPANDHPADGIKVEEGDTDTAPYGLGTYASRSTPTAGAAASMASRKIREKARKIAAHLLKASEDDLVWERGKFYVKGAPTRVKTIQEIAFAAYTNHPKGMEAGLEAVDYYDPPNLTFPSGSYICAVDIDRGTGEVKVRRFVAVDDCGVRINPMIVEGQIHGGLTMGFAPALLEEIVYDDNGNIMNPNFMDYLLPTAIETPRWETGETVTPSPHHPIGAKGVGESATVGAPAAIANAVVDALWHLGVRNIDIPLTPQKVWNVLKEHDMTLEE